MQHISLCIKTNNSTGETFLEKLLSIFIFLIKKLYGALLLVKNKVGKAERLIYADKIIIIYYGKM